MNLKTVTLIAAVTQAASVAGHLISTARLVQKLKWVDNAEWFLLQPVSLLGQIMLVVFLFTLVAKQKQPQR